MIYHGGSSRDRRPCKPRPYLPLRHLMIERNAMSQQDRIPPAMQRLVEQLVHIPGVMAVTLGGSRARGEGRPDSDWDFGVYYRGSINSADVRALGYNGYVAEPGEWGRLVNGGGWL